MLASSKPTRTTKNHFSTCLLLKVATFSNHENISFDIPSTNKVKKYNFFAENHLLVYENSRRIQIYSIMNVS